MASLDYPYEDHALEQISRMWWEIGQAAEIMAKGKLEGDFEDATLRYAELAEACYWKATGNTDAIDIAGGSISGRPRNKGTAQ